MANMIKVHMLTATVIRVTKMKFKIADYTVTECRRTTGEVTTSSMLTCEIGHLHMQ